MKNRRIQWLWLLPLFFLMAFIVVPRLAWDGLWYDEIFSVMNSRGAHYGPVSLEAIWTQVTVNDPHQALGYPLLLAAWGLAVGWTEFALRTFSFLSALLAVAMSYQLGKRLVSAPVGLAAASILAISTYFVNYAHELRSFTLIALCAASLLWAYHKLLFAKQPFSIVLQIIFVLSGMGLLWSHYYSAILLLALGLYHLLFVKKDKRWLHITGLALLVGLLFLPEVPSFLKGYTVYSPEDLEIAPLSAWGVVSAMVYFVGNNFALLTILALLSGLVYAWAEAIQLRMLILISLFATTILLISNEILGLLEPTRLRYLVFLWPLLAIWLGAGLVYIGKLLQGYLLPKLSLASRPMVSASLLLVLPLLWLGNGIYANYQPEFNALIAGDAVPRLRLMSNQLNEEASSEDLLVFYNGTNRQAWYMQLGLEYALLGQTNKLIFSSSIFHETEESIRLQARQQMADAQRVWYGVNRILPLTELHDEFLALVAEDFVHCGNRVNEWDISLDLYARSLSFCPTDMTIAEFGSWIDLRAYEQSLANGQLHLNLAWELKDGTPVDTYSLGIYIMPAGVTELLAQADFGFPNEGHALMSLDVDLSNLPAGRYDVWLAVYNWQTSERLLLPNSENLWLLTSIEKP